MPTSTRASEPGHFHFDDNARWPKHIHLRYVAQPKVATRYTTACSIQFNLGRTVYGPGSNGVVTSTKRDNGAVRFGAIAVMVPTQRIVNGFTLPPPPRPPPPPPPWALQTEAKVQIDTSAIVQSDLRNMKIKS